MWQCIVPWDIRARKLLQQHCDGVVDKRFQATTPPCATDGSLERNVIAALEQDPRRRATSRSMQSFGTVGKATITLCGLALLLHLAVRATL